MVSVSVIIPTYNSRALLSEALTALRAQTMPAEELEVIVVDDGSTDGTWAELQELATSWPQLQIVRQPNSGTPSVGRNVGLRRATGRYLFFHDADDWMPVYALADLVSRAETLAADVVVGRVRSIGGRRRRSRLREATDADLIADGVWRSLSAQKLFRRELIERSGLHFAEDMVQGEDQVFTATALLNARRVSTLVDEDYYVRRRDRGDGGNLSRQAQSLSNKVLTCTRLTEQIEAAVPVAEQPAYFDRVLLRTLAPALDGPFMHAGSDEQAAAIAELQRTVLPHLAERQLAKATDARRLRLLIAAAGEATDLLRLNQWWQTSRQIHTVDGMPRYAVPSSIAALLAPTDLLVSDQLRGPAGPIRPAAAPGEAPGRTGDDVSVAQKLRRYPGRLRQLLPLSGARRTPRGRAER